MRVTGTWYTQSGIGTAKQTRGRCSLFIDKRVGEKYEYITLELFLLLMTSLFTFYHCFTFCYHFLLFSCYWHQPVPYIYFTLPHIFLPFVTLPYLTFCLLLPYLTLRLTLPYDISYFTFSLALPYILTYLTSYLTFCITLPYLRCV